MKILKDEEYKRLKEFEKLSNAVFQARRWLSEFDDILEPMWNFILHKEERWTFEGGRIGVLIDGNIADAREVLRENVAKYLKDK